MLPNPSLVNFLVSAPADVLSAFLQTKFLGNTIRDNVGKMPLLTLANPFLGDPPGLLVSSESHFIVLQKCRVEDLKLAGTSW